MRTRRLTGLLAGLVIAVTISCDAPRQRAMPTQPDLLGSLTNTLGTLLSCSPEPYAADSALIGPNGGILQIGPHVLVVPKGALSTTVMISGDAPVGTVRSVRLYPAGLKFAKPAALTLDYHHCSLVSSLLPKKVAYTTDNLQILKILLSLDLPLAQKVTGQVNHFSRYAVSY